MSNQKITVEELIDIFYSFSKERNWEKNYFPLFLAQSVSIEAAELLEHFQWTDINESKEKVKDKAKKTAIAYEIIDVLYYLLMLAKVMDIDITSTAKEKLKELSTRYPKPSDILKS